MRSPVASISGTAQPILPGARPGDDNLTPGKLFIAQNADPLVVERIPVPEPVGRTQNHQALIQWQVGSDCHITSLQGSWIYTIGTENDCRIGENPSPRLVGI